MSDLSVQEKSDAWLERALLEANESVHPANIAISAMRLVRGQLERMSFLPQGHARRHIEDIASPNAARAVFTAMNAFIDDMPKRETHDEG